MTDKTWAEWLTEKLAGRPNVYLVKNSGTKENGRPRIDDSRVSKWLKGEQRPSVDLAILAAQVLEADAQEALSAAGYDPAVAPVDDSSAAGIRTMAVLYERLDESDRRLQSAIAEIVAAEVEHDALMRTFATSELMTQKAAPLYEARELEVGRPLTIEERIEVLSTLARPTQAEIAESVAWSAMHDVREWTRHEMALIEVVFDYPQDGRVGSGYADLEPFRQRVRRLGLGGDVSESEAPLPTKLTPLYQATPEFLASLSTESDHTLGKGDAADADAAHGRIHDAERKGESPTEAQGDPGEASHTSG